MNNRYEKNLSSASDAYREIPILGSTDNAGNSIKLVLGIIRLPSGWDFSTLGSTNKRGLMSFRHYPFTLGLGFLGLHRTLMKDSKSVTGLPRQCFLCGLSMFKLIVCYLWSLEKKKQFILSVTSLSVSD